MRLRPSPLLLWLLVLGSLPGRADAPVDYRELRQQLTERIRQIVDQETLPRGGELLDRLPPASTAFQARTALEIIEVEWPPARRSALDEGRYRYLTGWMLEAAGRADSAMSHFAAAGMVFDHYRRPDWVAWVNYSQEYFMATDPGYPDRGRLLDGVIATARARGLAELEAKACSLKGYVALEEDRLDAARTWYEAALTVNRREGYHRAALVDYANLSLQALYAGEGERCEGYLDAALALADAQGLTREAALADLHINLAELYIDREAFPRADSYLARAEQLLRGLDDLEKWVNWYDLRAHYYDVRDLTDSTLYYVNAMHRLDDSLRVLRNNRQNAETMIQYRTEDAEADSRRAREEARILLIQRNLTVGVGLLLVVSLIALGFLVRQRRKTARLRLENVRVRKDAEIEALIRDNQLTMMRGMLEGQEEERKRISRELHDDLGGLLTGLRWTYDHLAQTLSGDADTASSFARANKDLGRAYAKVRDLSHTLSYHDLRQFGLESALRELAERLHTPGKLDVTLTSHGTTHRLPGHVEIELFQVINELCTNTLKHAHATRLSIELTWMDDLLGIIVTDDGDGFDDSELGSGMGLYGLEQRIAEIGGQLHIDTGLGAGTTTLIDLPLTGLL